MKRGENPEPLIAFNLMADLQRCALLAFLFTVVSFPQSPPTAGPTFQIDRRDLTRSLKMVFYGDTRFTTWRFAGNVTSPWARRALIEKIASERPDALFISGDIPFQGAQRADYHVFFSESAIWRRDHLRVYPVLGNHEFYARDFVPSRQRGLQNWWEAFPFLKGMQWYSVQLGDQIYALCLDSNFGALKSGSAQRIWIDRQLAALPESIGYVFVVLHHAGSGDYLERQGHKRSQDTSASDLDPYLERKQQNMRARIVVISGHVHNYGRLERNGVVYIISGGGGAHPVFFRRQTDDKFRGKDLVRNGHALPNYNYLVCELDSSGLHAGMVRISNPEALSGTASWDTPDTFTMPAPKS